MLTAKNILTGKPNTYAIVGSATIVAAAVLAGCETGGTAPPNAATLSSSSFTTPAADNHPPGGILDTQAYVPFTPPLGLFTVSVPAGWARGTKGDATVFTDNLNVVSIATRPLAVAPNTESVAVDELPAIASSTPGYRPGMVTAVRRKAGQIILITYQGSSPPNPGTLQASTEAIEHYEYWRAGNDVILTLSGPVGTDNAKAWRTITDSLQWR
jgi:hypothetical protein